MCFWQISELKRWVRVKIFSDYRFFCKGHRLVVKILIKTGPLITLSEDLIIGPIQKWPSHYSKVCTVKRNAPSTSKSKFTVSPMMIRDWIRGKVEKKENIRRVRKILRGTLLKNLFCRQMLKKVGIFRPTEYLKVIFWEPPGQRVEPTPTEFGLNSLARPPSGSSEDIKYYHSVITFFICVVTPSEVDRSQLISDYTSSSSVGV